MSMLSVVSVWSIEKSDTGGAEDAQLPGSMESPNREGSDTVVDEGRDMGLGVAPNTGSYILYSSGTECEGTVVGAWSTNDGEILDEPFNSITVAGFIIEAEHSFSLPRGITGVCKGMGIPVFHASCGIMVVLGVYE